MIIDNKITKIVGGGYEIAEVRYMDKTEWSRNSNSFFTHFIDDSIFYDIDEKGKNGLPLRKIKSEKVEKENLIVYAGVKGTGLKIYTMYGGKVEEIKKGFKTLTVNGYTVTIMKAGYVFVYDSYYKDDIEILVNPLDLIFENENNSYVYVGNHKGYFSGSAESEELEMVKSEFEKLR